MPLNTFVVAVISPERSILDTIGGPLEKHENISAVWMLNGYPAAGHLEQLRDAPGGCVVFLDFTDSLRARAIASELDRSYPAASVVAVHPGNGQQDLLELMQLGIREVITIPLESQEIVRVCERAARRVNGQPGEGQPKSSLYAFLPARPGSGSTTIAAHSAAAAARISRQPTLLIDFDLRLGMLSFLFKLHGDQSVLEALQLGGHLEETLWRRMLCRCGDLEILGSAPFEYGCPAPEAGAGAVLDFARQKYTTICVDLPGEMRSHELETIQRADEIFLVCTSDLGALHMAKRKADFLQTLDARPRISLIMNRADVPGPMPVKRVEEVLQLPVRFTVPSAEKEISAATRNAVPIDGSSEIAGRIEKIARRMVAAAKPAAAEATVTRRFLEFFSVTPVRDTAAWGR